MDATSNFHLIWPLWTLKILFNFLSFNMVGIDEYWRAEILLKRPYVSLNVFMINKYDFLMILFPLRCPFIRHYHCRTANKLSTSKHTQIFKKKEHFNSLISIWKKIKWYSFEIEAYRVSFRIQVQSIRFTILTDRALKKMMFLIRLNLHSQCDAILKYNHLLLSHCARRMGNHPFRFVRSS